MGNSIPSSHHQTRFAASRRRGSTLLLVLAALLLTMILGVSYMQVVRLDRKGQFELQRQRDMDMQQASIINLIALTIRDDLGIDGSGTFFTGTNATGGGTRMLYDYPDSTRKPWLASSEPAIDPLDSSYKWLQVTQLTGPGTTVAPQDASAAGVASTSDGDADGDGITDSRPETPPIAVMRGISYYMWVRIVDNSGKINVNTSSGLVDSSGLYGTSYASAPRNTFPGELDLANFAFATNHGGSTAEVPNALGYTMGAGVALPVPYATRASYWLNGPALYGNGGASYKKHEIDSEFELRMRGGLSSFFAAPTLENSSTGMPTMLRQYPSSQLTSGGGSKVVEATYKDSLANMGYTLTGTPATDIPEFFARDPRHAMTTLSGANIHAPRIPTGGTADPTGRLLKKDLNTFAINATYSTATAAGTALAAELMKVINADATGGTAYVPPASVIANLGTVGGTSTVKSLFCAQYAANIIDFKDTDNKLTKIPDPLNGSVFRYGYEALPYISETYVQAAATASGAGPTNFTWTQIAASTSMAIEIRNPNPYPISLQNVNIHINPTGTASAPTNLLGDLATLAARTSLGANSSVVIYRNGSGGGGPEGAHDDLSALIPSTATCAGALLTGTPSTNLLAFWPTSPSGIFPITLRCTDANTNAAATWDYQVFKGRVASTLPTGVACDPATPYVPAIAGHTAGQDGLVRYRQISIFGNNNGMNTMTVWNADLLSNAGFYANSLLTSSATQQYRIYSTTAFTRFGVTPKTGALYQNVAITVPASWITNTNNNQFLSHPSPDPDNGKVMHTGDLALVPIFGTPGSSTLVPGSTIDTTVTPNLPIAFPERFIGPAPTARAAQSGTAPTYTEKFMLDFSASQLVGTGDLAVPYAVFLMDRFTNMSPAEDGVDNDGVSGADPGDTKEMFVPGTINLNTVPYDTLRYVLPIPGTQAKRDAIATAIVNFREAASGGRPGIAGYRTTKGIAYLGEMYNLQIAAANNPGTDGVESSEADFLGQPDPAAMTADGIIDDREEKSMLMRWIMQTCSVRSDIFTAYILIRGYAPSASVASYQRRVVAVFDRSRVITATDMPRVLGIMQY